MKNIKSKIFGNLYTNISESVKEEIISKLTRYVRTYGVLKIRVPLLMNKHLVIKTSIISNLQNAKYKTILT